MSGLRSGLAGLGCAGALGAGIAAAKPSQRLGSFTTGDVMVSIASSRDLQNEIFKLLRILRRYVRAAPDLVCESRCRMEMVDRFEGKARKFE